MNTIDIKRKTFGLPPIYCDSPRPLTDDERRSHFRQFGHGNDGDIVVREEGLVVRHLIPMVHHGWIVYCDVTG
jgi:hypothetical protein